MEGGVAVRGAGRLGEWFPWPFVFVAILLGVLIVLTPVLTAGGQPAAGSIFSQAELIVDALPGNNSTHFYVRGLGTTARYDAIDLAFAYGFNWTGAFPSGPLNWTVWQNTSNVLSTSFATNEDPVAVNVTALYTANGASALYVGVFAIDVGYPGGSTTETLSVVSDTSGISSFATALSNLPVPIVLSNVGSGGAP
jgi:hypothetical protein